MDVARHVEAIRRDSAELLDAARLAPPVARLESCPEWTPADLVWHVAVVHDFFASRVRGEDQYRALDRPADDETLWRVAGTSRTELLDQLTTTDPSTTIATWAGASDVAWVARRIAQETAVHRVDAERAAGRDHQPDAQLAADGVDEFLTVFVPNAPARGMPMLPGSVHVHCTDVDGEWIVEPTGDRYEIRRAHEKGDAAMRGAAQDLFLVLWRRLPLEAVDVVGDRAVAEALTSMSI